MESLLLREFFPECRVIAAELDSVAANPTPPLEDPDE